MRKKGDLVALNVELLLVPDRLVRVIKILPVWSNDRKATVTQITTRYNQGMQNTISERTTCWTLNQIGYSSRRPHRVLLLSAKNRKRRLQFTQVHQNCTIEDWKNVAWSDESRFLLRHSDGRVRIWRKEHESMDSRFSICMLVCSCETSLPKNLHNFQNITIIVCHEM